MAGKGNWICGKTPQQMLLIFGRDVGGVGPYLLAKFWEIVLGGSVAKCGNVKKFGGDFLPYLLSSGAEIWWSCSEPWSLPPIWIWAFYLFPPIFGRFLNFWPKSVGLKGRDTQIVPVLKSCHFFTGICSVSMICNAKWSRFFHFLLGGPPMAPQSYPTLGVLCTFEKSPSPIGAC